MSFSRRSIGSKDSKGKPGWTYSLFLKSLHSLWWEALTDLKKNTLIQWIPWKEDILCQEHIGMKWSSVVNQIENKFKKHFDKWF